MHHSHLLLPVPGRLCFVWIAIEQRQHHSPLSYNVHIRGCRRSYFPFDAYLDIEADGHARFTIYRRHCSLCHRHLAVRCQLDPGILVSAAWSMETRLQCIVRRGVGDFYSLLCHSLQREFQEICKMDTGNHFNKERASRLHEGYLPINEYTECTIKYLL